MIPSHRRFPRLLVLLPVVLFSACAVGGTIHMPGDLARPSDTSSAPVVAPAGPASVVLVDFVDNVASGKEIGRDYLHSRSISWNGSRGKGVTDLVEAIMKERGISVRRVATAADLPADASTKIGGTVGEFRVEARRAAWWKLVQVSGAVGVRVEASTSALTLWTTDVAADTVFDDIFVTPDTIYSSMNTAANLVAEEAVRRLVEKGVLVLPPQPPQVIPSK